jgi:hypothetical protein
MTKAYILLADDSSRLLCKTQFGGMIGGQRASEIAEVLYAARPL